MNKSGPITLLLLLFILPSTVHGKVLTSDTIWSGEVIIDEDILIPEGITLTVLPGAVIRISPAESTKTDPEYLSPHTEITVRGRLVAEANRESPVIFLISGEKKTTWAGIIIDGGKAVLRFCTIRDAETGIEVIKGILNLQNSLLTKNRYGLTVQRNDTDVRIESSEVRENDYGVFLFNGAEIESKDTLIKENRKKDHAALSARAQSIPLKEYRAGNRDTGRVYGDEALIGMTVWSGRIEVNGIIRVPENSRLIILPGTIVEFTRKDTNNDGIGEHGILIQGMLIAKGTREHPIIFRSAEKQRRMGDWDAINIMNSDSAQNLIEYCQIEDAYRGLHFHFSNVAVADSIMRNNYRGIQFQESVVEIRRSHLYGNKSGLQARDSEIMFSDNVLSRNYTAMNILRNTVILRGNSFANNLEEGLRVREGIPRLEENLMYGNRHGLMVTDAVYGTFERNVISHNLESGMALRNTDNIEIKENAVQGNGLNGITIQDSGAVIRGNLISDNGERGIGVLSFHGIITENNILKNKLYNLGIDGETDVSAVMNWWGGDDLQKTIYDKEDDPSRGRAEYLPVRHEPAAFMWPLKTIGVDAVWHGEILIDGSITVLPGAGLVVSPGTKVFFSAGGGLIVQGRIVARGMRDERILFTSRPGKEGGVWDEILLDHAEGSAFAYAAFVNATWALHVHFTHLTVEQSAFVGNQGGVRFMSGPLTVKNSFFSENEIGIRSFRGNAYITENIFVGNATAIFVREKGSELTIQKNNFFSNTKYNIRLGDFNDEDVDARDNWWGEGNPSDMIFDSRKEPGIGTVHYEPYLREPFLPALREVK